MEKLKLAIEKSKPDIIFHLAAQPIVRKSYEDPIITYRSNLIGTINLLEILRDSPNIQSAVFITSDKCYENVEQHKGYTETDRLGGKDPYSSSKACAEIAISSYFRSYFIDSALPKIAIGRAGNVIGGGDWAKDRIIPDCIKAWSKDIECTLRNPDATRPWQHVLEPLSGYLLLGAKLAKGVGKVNGQPFNFGPDQSVVKTVEELIITMTKFWNSKKWNTIQFDDSNKKEAGLLSLDCSKAKNYLNWNPILDFEETVKFTTEWYKNYYDTKEDILDFTENQIGSYVNYASERDAEWTK